MTALVPTASGMTSRFILSASVVLGALFSTAAQASEPVCEVDRPIKFSGLNWESNLLMMSIERTIVEKGYGCQTQAEQGETLPMLAALQRGDVDVTPEVWPGQIEEAWAKALQSGKVEGVGHVFDAGEAWYIPRYTAERYPELKSAADLAKFKDKFTDPEDPAKGRIFGCPVGWACGTLNDNLIRALKLEGDFNMFAPGAGAAQKAAIQSAYKRKRDIVFYYWTPTALVGGLDLVELALPEFDQAAYTCMTTPECKNPVPTQFKGNPVVTGLNTDFSSKAPKLKAFFEKISMPSDVIDSTLGKIETEGLDVEDAAAFFMKNHQDIWTKWVPEDVATRIKKTL